VMVGSQFHIYLLSRLNRIQVLDNRREQCLSRFAEDRVQVGGMDAQAQVGGVVEGFVHVVDVTALAETTVVGGHERNQAGSHSTGKEGRVLWTRLPFGYLDGVHPVSDASKEPNVGRGCNK